MSSIYDPDNIAIDEPVSHFLLTKSEFSIANNRVKPKALEPSREHKSTSVVRTLNLVEDEIWKWGEINMPLEDHQNLYARAEMVVKEIISKGLRIARHEPPERHANIFNWHNDKSAMMSQAQDLAASSTLILNTNILNQKLSG